MNQQASIITFSVKDDPSLLIPPPHPTNKISIENEPPITISNKNDASQKHPFSSTFLENHHNKNQSEPLLLTPRSILSKSGHTHVLPLNKDDHYFDPRPSLVTFSSNNDVSSSHHTVYYDAQKSITTTDSRRPSIMSRISSAYTNKLSDIPFHAIDPFDPHLLQQGIVLCATTTAMSKQQGVQKRPLQWRKYCAVITQSGYLELYHVCSHQERNPLHRAASTSCIHSHLPHYKKPGFIIDLHPSIHNPLFQKQEKQHLLFHHRSFIGKQGLDDTYFLSLMSPIDFSWSLSSTHQTFFFQTESVSTSRQWYQSLYACLPSQSKTPLPTLVDLNVPELSVSIRLPLSELMQLGEENIDLDKVRDSALVLLHRYGHRPAHWNKRTTGLQWRYKQYSDWAIKPSCSSRDDFTAFLIEARLIEKTHTLELHYYQEKEKETKPSQRLEGYLNRITKGGKSVLLYAQCMGHFLFLFETEQVPPPPSSSCCFSLLLFKKKHRLNRTTSPSFVLKQVIDLSLSKKISCSEKANTLHVDNDTYCFQGEKQPIADWYTQFESMMMRPVSQSGDDNEIKRHDVLYVKSAAHRYQTFEKKTCILTRSGLFCILNKHGAKVDFYSHLREDEHYIYSGDTCCSYIRGLPVELPCRMFDSGIIEQHNQPNQCCFVVCFTASRKEYIFLTKTQGQKEDWVNAITN